MVKKIDTLKEIHEIELEMLDAVDYICNKYNLRYFLAGGTLLGAVRHKGFIPWDDDVDISMPRNDYDKFLEIMEEGYRDFAYYRIYQVKEKSDYSFPFAKLSDMRTIIKNYSKEFNIQGMGAYIDIFPIDGFGNDLKNAKKIIVKQNVKGHRISRAFSGFSGCSLVKKCTLLIWKIQYFFKGREKSYRILEQELRKNEFDTSKYVGSTFGLRGEKEIIEQRYFADSLKMKFENREYKVPVGYDQYLKQMYGDYMQLPPVNERIAPHNMDIYWKE
jgi:lipopolysaccharide cholinephosphotransferase